MLMGRMEDNPIKTCKQNTDKNNDVVHLQMRTQSKIITTEK